MNIQRKINNAFMSRVQIDLVQVSDIGELWLTNKKNTN